MKLSAGTIGYLVMGFVWCLFMGVTAVSIGLGALYPPLNLIAKPFVCPNGQMTYQESTSNPLPGTTYTLIGWYCVDSRAENTTQLDIFQIAVAAGIPYGLVIAVLALIAVVVLRRRSSATGQTYTPSARRAAAHRPAGTGGPPAPSAGSLARMQELKRLRAEQLITEAEYQHKRDEILKEL